MTSINNSGILNICSTCGCAAFAPLLNYVYTPATTYMVLTDGTSTYDAGDSFKRINVTVSDFEGNSAYGAIYNTGSGAILTVTLTSTVVTAIGITNGGSLYCGGGSGKINISIVGTGSGAIVIGNVVGGIITSTTIIAGGTGYVTPTATAQANTVGIQLSGLSNVAATGVNINATMVTTKACVVDLIEYRIGVGNVAVTSVVGNTTNEVDKDLAIDIE